jgi:hypothetical protein
VTRKILKNDWDTFTQVEFRIENNVWNKGTLAAGRDYTQTISYDPKHLTHELKFSWNWPKADHVLAFPELEAGYKPWSETGSDDLTTRLSKLTALDVSFDYDISGQTSRFNVGFDMWLTRKPTTDSRSITTEVSVWTHTGTIDPDGHKVGNFRDGAFRGEIWVDNAYGHAGSDQTWRYITIRANQDVTEGNLDIDHVMQDLIDRKLVKSTDYFNGYEFGAQLTGGKGSLTIHDLDHEFAAKGSHATPAHMDAATDHFLF